MHGTRHRSARDLADAELQSAIQLSLQEVGAVNGHARPGYVPSQPSPSPSPSAWQHSEPPIVDRGSRPTAQAADEEDDPDLRAAIEASLREANAPKPSAPIAFDSPQVTSYTGPGYSQSYPPAVLPAPPVQPSYELEPLESDAILTFSQMIEQVEAQGGKDISRYPAMNELYDKANSLRPKLALSLDDAGRKERRSPLRLSARLCIGWLIVIMKRCSRICTISYRKRSNCMTSCSRSRLRIRAGGHSPSPAPPLLHININRAQVIALATTLLMRISIVSSGLLLHQRPREGINQNRH